MSLPPQRSVLLAKCRRFSKGRHHLPGWRVCTRDACVQTARLARVTQSETDDLEVTVAPQIPTNFFFSCFLAIVGLCCTVSSRVPILTRAFFLIRTRTRDCPRCAREPAASQDAKAAEIRSSSGLPIQHPRGNHLERRTARVNLDIRKKQNRRKKRIQKHSSCR